MYICIIFAKLGFDMGEKSILKIYKDSRTVFSFNELALLLNCPDSIILSKRMNYYVKTNQLLNIRKGFYAKENFNKEEFVCKLFKPSYLSLETVLQKEAVIFQYSNKLTAISHLSRSISIKKNTEIEISYRKIKNNILINTTGIERKKNGINKATKERAFLDTLYLSKDYYFDNLKELNKDKITELLKIYKSKALQKRVEIQLKNVRY